jgi:hypothetical protein
MADDADRLNRAFWDEISGLHGQGDYYDTEAFLRGEPSLTRRELDEIPPPWVALKALTSYICSATSVSTRSRSRGWALASPASITRMSRSTGHAPWP